MTIPTPWIQTPLVESPVLSEAAGCKVNLKIETIQPGRSFKSRGVGNYMLARLLERLDGADKPSAPQKLHFFSSSGGNAGIAAVRAAIALGHSCTVVVPLSTKQRMIDLVRTAGARDVIQFGASWREADTYLREELVSKDPNGIYVPPFDHPDVWAGNATMIREIYQSWGERHPNRRKPAAVVCSVGGGGLFCGIMQGLRECGWSDVPVIALETLGADSLRQSIDAGRLVTLAAITSNAKSLGATRCAEQAFDYARDKQRVISVVLTDAEAAMGCVKLADEERMMVELSCGINVAMCYGGRLQKALGRSIGPDEEIIVIVCGGNDITVDQLHHWRTEMEGQMGG